MYKKLILYLILLLFYSCKTLIQNEKKEFLEFTVEFYKSSLISKIVMIHLDPLSFSKKIFLKSWNPYWLKHKRDMYYIELPQKKILEPKEVLFIYQKIQETYSLYNKKIILVGASFGGISFSTYSILRRE